MAGKIMHFYFLFYHFRKACFLLIGLNPLHKLSLQLTTFPVTDKGHRLHPRTGGALEWISHFSACVHLGDKEAVPNLKRKYVLLSSVSMFPRASHLLTFTCDTCVRKPVCCIGAQSYTTYRGRLCTL